MARPSDVVLFRHSEETYKGSFSTDLLEQYKLYGHSAENVSARRVASSRHLLALNVALVALYGFQSSDLGWNSWALLVPILGVLVSILWYRIIKSHSDLNGIKFAIIHALEERFPTAPFAREWFLVKQGRGRPYRARNRYRTLETFSFCHPPRRSLFRFT